MSRKLVTVLLSLLGLLTAAIALLPALVRSLAEDRAEERGWWVEIEGVRPAWGGVWLLGVKAGLRDDDALSVELNALEVGISLSGGLRSLEAQGGHIRIQTDLESLKDRLFRAKSAEGAPASKSGRVVSVRGMEVEVSAGLLDGSKVWGAEYHRSGDTETVGADRVELLVNGVALTADSSQLVARRGPAGRTVASIAARALTIDLDLDHLAGRDASQAPSSPPRPVAAIGLSPTDDPDQGPAANSLLAVPWSPSWGPQLRERVRRAAEEAGPWFSRESRVELSGVHVRAHRGGGTLNLGPASLTMGRDGDFLSLEFVPGAAAKGSQVRLLAKVPVGDGEVQLELGGGPVTLAQLGIQDGDMGLYQVASTLLDLETKLSLAADGKRLALDASGSIDHLNLYHPRLANVPADGVQLGWRGQAQLALDGSSLAIKAAELRVGRVGVRLAALLQRADDGVEVSVDVNVPKVACESMLASIPPALIPLLSGARSKGTFALDAHLAFSASDPTDITLAWNVQNKCGIVDPPSAIEPKNFLGVFEYRVYGPDGAESLRVSGPGTLDWVPLPDISSHMETAVLVCEDSRFWHHQGFDAKAIKSSITDNLRAGRFARGASTISMQLAKNLYLAREKTLSRKLQEVALTMLLEQELRKDELLELYFNVIEYGPNVFGIRDAAQYYFGVEPRDLSLAQALFLGSILPQPRARHFDDEGRLKPRRAEYLARLMHIAHKIERITDEELQQGLSEELVFAGRRRVGTEPPGEQVENPRTREL